MPNHEYREDLAEHHRGRRDELENRKRPPGLPPFGFPRAPPKCLVVETIATHGQVAAPPRSTGEAPRA